ncbi:hypothetical protein KQI63_03995 [bacterium]|nr:hypothetical protein [bacterium]
MFERLFASRRPKTERSVSRPLETRNALTVSPPPIESLRNGSGFQFTGLNRGDFYRFLRDRIPIVSSGIWTWVHLCTTPQRLELAGGEAEVHQAGSLLEDLQGRIYPRLDGDRHGLERLVESSFLDLFTLGRMALRVHLLPDRSGVSHIEALDPYRIRWQRLEDGRSQPWYEKDNGELEALDSATFFHRTLTSDLHQPDGVDPLASIPFVVEIEQRMLEDMARSSHNAGTQRLQIRLAPPNREPGEDQESYTRRINSYFDTTVRQFRELGPDDNVFTWSDVEVELIGGSGSEGSVWKINREQVIEDVITGLKLFPWALGRSHGTTKNWIFAQYNLLMQIVDSVQRTGTDLAEWLLHLELRLHGNLATPRWLFAPNQDPFIVERNKAKLLELERAERLVEAGILSLNQAARELGYDKAWKGE